MKRISLGLVLFAAPLMGLASNVVTLECTGTSPSGKSESIKIRYDANEGWVEDHSAIKYRDGVTPHFLTGIRVQYDRDSREYATRPTTAGEKFKGSCKQVEPKA